MKHSRTGPHSCALPGAPASALLLAPRALTSGDPDPAAHVPAAQLQSVKDPSMAPAGKHCLHAYLPATEPYEIWKGLDRRRWGAEEDVGG